MVEIKSEPSTVRFLDFKKTVTVFENNFALKPKVLAPWRATVATSRVYTSGETGSLTTEYFERPEVYPAEVFSAGRGSCRTLKFPNKVNLTSDEYGGVPGRWIVSRAEIFFDQTNLRNFSETNPGNDLGQTRSRGAGEPRRWTQVDGTKQHFAKPLIPNTDAVGTLLRSLRLFCFALGS